ncbi:Delta(3,5)-Delta(2,4)-dienoyl-CoA isomerase, mitochondrial [Escovopsis weberi]|uniref:Delta(3,5)-Delta(2,4)-dienoyl-CoA isomerase, mitochondrial n=1 Tax=Escovopsis weberi TaxID=150374 RepID=A0A0M8N1Z6_ESCWE|nr:Delta(3,5)-Delta(2,4)-dienoyl-CoA isomerase, mitochondrial [Escovopsis weberi]
MEAPLPAYASYEYFVVSSPSPFVAHVEINRPAKINAFSEAVWREFGRVFGQLSGDEDVRAVVLSGRGERGFSAGLDVQDAAGHEALGGQAGEAGEAGAVGRDAARRAKVLRRNVEEFQGCISAMEKCEKPVIAVLHGVSIGLAIDIACCADVRVCAADTRFAVKEVDIGLAADVGTLARLPKIVGSTSWVKEVCLLARDFDGAEALAAGFVSAVAADKAAALAVALGMAGRMASKSPVAVQGTKELLNHARDHATGDALRYTGVWNSVALQAADFPAAIMSVLRKTRPTFAKL